MTYIQNALLIYDDEKSEYLNLVDDNEFGCLIKKVNIYKFLQNPLKYKLYASHLLLSCSDENINQVLQIVVDADYSIAFLPTSQQKYLIKTYKLSSIIQKNIEIALEDNLQKVDLILCNGQYFHHKVHLGDIPLIESINSKDNFLVKLVSGLKQFFKLKLFDYEIATTNEKSIKTAASGVLITNHVQESGFMRSLFSDTSMRDSKLSMIVVSPFSIVEYFLFLFSILSFSNKYKKSFSSVAFLRSDYFEIKTKNVPVILDGIIKIKSPIKCEIQKEVLSLSVGSEFWEFNPKLTQVKDSSKISNLPDEKERLKYTQKHLPFFAVASAERFKELFQILRDDSKLNTQYLMLMFLSTLLASIGLFANSTAVVIGAMVLAPLMTPIVSLSMGILRGEQDMIKGAIFKIFIGILVAISASALMAVLLPQVNLTGEIKARINPTLLDLGVAVFSGIAAAYSKSHKSIRDSLAGVAIAVALVPPLATAGIGLGRGEFYVFYGAFLLFFTNLIGITLASTITFQFLGFSNAVKSKKSLLIVSTLLVIISYPLFLSYTEIIEKYKFNSALAKSRFLVDDKYIIIKSASIVHKDEVDIVSVQLILRESLNRFELVELKKKIQNNYKKKIYLRIETEYVL